MSAGTVNSDSIARMSPCFCQVRGQIMHEFSILEYEARSDLASLLATQPNRPLTKYKQQFELVRKFKREQATELNLNPKVLENPDVQRMDADLTAAEVQS